MAENYQVIGRGGTATLNGTGGRVASITSPRVRTGPTAVVEVIIESTATVGGAGSRSSRSLNLHELYSVEVGRSALVIRAKTLLTKGEQSLKAAIENFGDLDDPLRSDYEVTLFQGNIPELFCCNSIGDAFATTVLAIWWALKNRKGQPLKLDQLIAVHSCVTSLNRELFMTYDRALDLVDDLEEVGLNVDISIATPLQQLLID
jgi:hypothetical protein